jgi:hypothetical protein
MSFSAFISLCKFDFNNKSLLFKNLSLACFSFFSLSFLNSARAFSPSSFAFLLFSALKISSSASLF